jgi:hypothetical protein
LQTRFLTSSFPSGQIRVKGDIEAANTTRTRTGAQCGAATSCLAENNCSLHTDTHTMESQGTNNAAGPQSDAVLRLQTAATVCTVGPQQGTPSHVLPGSIRGNASTSLATTLSRLPSSFSRGTSSASQGSGNGDRQVSHG